MWHPLNIIIVCIITLQLTVLHIQSLPCLLCAAEVRAPWLSWDRWDGRNNANVLISGKSEKHLEFNVVAF